MLNPTNKFKLPRNPYLLFSPFLFLYVILILKFQVNYLVGDESRHLYYTKNLLHGFYSPHSPHVSLGIGPGYPIIIAPFMGLGLPYLFIKLLNAVFYYLSLVFLFKALQQMVSLRKALLVCLFWSCNYITFKFMYAMLTETVSIFLITLLIFTLTKAFKPENIKKEKIYLYLSGFLMGYIALTKLIFGYVILCLLIGSIILWLIKRNAPNYRKGLIIVAIAFGTTAPYLIYTYYLTGRIFYWGTLAGNNMYWMSAPSANEYGSWFPDLAPDAEAQKKNPVIRIKRIFVPGTEDSLRLYHQADFDEIITYDGTQLDDTLKEIAYRNIRSHPAKYVQNCVSNIGRMLFGYPNSYMIQKPGDLVRLLPNGIIVVLSLFCLFPTLMNWRKIDYCVRFMLFFALLYLGGSVFGSADIRMFSIIAPIILFWIAFVIQKSVKVKLKFL